MTMDIAHVLAALHERAAKEPDIESDEARLEWMRGELRSMAVHEDAAGWHENAEALRRAATEIHS